jgi:hypothetical protein
MVIANSSNPYVDELYLNDLRKDTSFPSRQQSKAISNGIAGIDAPEPVETEIVDWQLDQHLEEIEPDYEELRKDPYADEFNNYDPIKDKERRENRGKNKRAYRRIGKKRRIGPLGLDLDEEDLFEFLGFLDRVWRRLYKILEDTVEEFSDWNKWFKRKERKAPPPKSKEKPLFVREEFKSQRSPHIWKSDPKKKWILTFGAPQFNNKVTEILYKYQNDTISKDA